MALFVCVSSCFRLLLHYSRQLLGDEILSEFWTGMNLFQFPSRINITNLRLALLDRDFNEADYEMLLALDERAASPSSDVVGRRHPSWNELPLNPPIYFQGKGGEEIKETMCTICLENFDKGQLLRRLTCGHVYHEKCIATWWKQKGKKTTCPICKATLF